ncbi:MAG: hypothetical protein RR382_06015 [Tannerellaceae bacterium]
MDNAGDWLYIVFLVVAGLSGLIGSGKKKKKQTEVLGQPGREITTEAEPAPEKGFWEILQEMQQGEEAPKPAPRPVSVAPQPVRKAKQNTATAFLSEEDRIYKAHVPESHIPMLATPPTIGRFAEEEQEGTDLDISFRDPADLRKAVIYAEILNRKY